MKREEAIQILADLTDNLFLHTWEEQYKALHMAIEALSADRPTGEWFINDAGDAQCSICGEVENAFIYGTEDWYGRGESHFCPNCGAKMFRQDGKLK